MRWLTYIRVLAVIVCVPSGCTQRNKSNNVKRPLSASAENKQRDTLQPIQNRVENPANGDILAESKGWIYLHRKGSHSWTKLIPGRCPQWFAHGRRFYYFLDVGYDGPRAELWSADINGKAMLRESRCDYFIRRSPVVSECGKKLAWHYSTCHASGFFEDIKVIHLSSLSSEKNLSQEEKVVMRCPRGTNIGEIVWNGDYLLSAMIDGQERQIDTRGDGETPLQ